MTMTAIEIQKRIDAHNRYVEANGRYEPLPPSSAKIKPARPRKGKEPTLAQAIAAGTKVTLFPGFVADCVALIETEDVDAWVRASLLAELEAKRSIGSQLKDLGKRRLRYVQGMTPAELIALTENPEDTRRMAEEKLAAVGLMAERPKAVTVAGLLALYAAEKEADNADIYDAD